MPPLQTHSQCLTIRMRRNNDCLQRNSDCRRAQTRYAKRYHADCYSSMVGQKSMWQERPGVFLKYC